MLNLDKVTLLGVDCINVERLINAINICKKYATFAQIKLLTSIDTNYENAVKIPHIGSIQEYSKFMIRDLYKYVDTDFVLCIQWDAWILDPDQWTDEYYNYDYTGAPWWFNDDRNVGNGAFSLRSKKFLEVCSELPIKNYHPEDLVLCRTYKNLLLKEGIKFAPEKLAHRFSHEGNQKYGRKWDNSFGYHDLEMTDISRWKPPSDFHIIYRACDKNPLTHLEGVTKQQCMINFKKVFDVSKNSTLILDNCSIEGTEWYEAMGFKKVLKTKLGNAESLKRAFEIALDLPDDDIVYFVEDDFLHLKGVKELLIEGLEKADYVSCYDHSDKYINNGPNPFIHNGGEETCVFTTKSSHWKYTNSTVQTFACRVRTLKEDKEILWKYNFDGPVPDSFKTFTALRSKGRTIATCIPGRSTHCHSPWESPFVKWKRVKDIQKEEQQ